ncbi:MAG: NADH-quinone oxidoreductase subunit M [Armatimonadetes bacterium]|nr:NADH-quinone oxidoreductase subunit M [Armatimonadota bacterium]
MHYNQCILSLLIFLPLAGAAVLPFFPRKAESAAKGFAFVLALITFALSVPLFFLYSSSGAVWQFEVQKPWIQLMGQPALTYHIGLDGISLVMVLLTTFLSAVAILGSFAGIKDRQKEYYALMLLLESAMIGVFCALDLVLFYVFWEAMLIPMYFIIGMWGGQRRIYAAVKFFLYTMVGSLLMLVAILVMVWINFKTTGELTFDLPKLYVMHLTAAAQTLLFLAFALAFAIKVPMFPFHTWLPDAHVEAPTAGSVILAGLLLKMGTYGFLRFCLPLFPNASLHFAPLLVTLAIISIIYGALVALRQPDMKKLVAYTSVSHLGIAMLGIFVFTLEGLQGGVYQMISHGLATGALFLLVGMIYERRHTRQIADYGGIYSVMPKYGAVFIIITMASIGLPFLSGFVGEFLVFLGSWMRNPWYAVLGASTAVLSACYLLWMVQRVLHGPMTNEENKSLLDLSAREIAVLTPLAVGVIFFGVYPKPILERVEPSVLRIVQTVENARQASISPSVPSTESRRTHASPALAQSAEQPDQLEILHTR